MEPRSLFRSQPRAFSVADDGHTHAARQVLVQPFVALREALRVRVDFCTASIEAALLIRN